MHRLHKMRTDYHDSQKCVKKATQAFLQKCTNIHTFHCTFQLKCALEAVKHQQFLFLFTRFMFLFTRFTGADN